LTALLGKRFMNITMLALGSYGDVLPVVTLGKGLKVAGHEVRFATFENFEKMVTQHGLDFHPIRGEPFSMQAADAH
jgi:UDP:flavonoid glycosyltransferase YjiC (YdhE family)